MTFLVGFHMRVFLDCIDERKECVEWAKKGECSKNPDYMLKDCCKSCTNPGKINKF